VTKYAAKTKGRNKNGEISSCPFASFTASQRLKLTVYFAGVRQFVLLKMNFYPVRSSLYFLYDIICVICLLLRLFYQRSFIEHSMLNKYVACVFSVKKNLTCMFYKSGSNIFAKCCRSSGSVFGCIS
jgi:hypothetical protein